MATYQEVQCKEFGECIMTMDMKTAKQILNENGFLLEDTNTKSLVGKFWTAKKNGESLSKEDAEALLNAPDFDEVVKLDLEYIDNWSLLGDIKILFKTVYSVIKRDGAE